MTIPRQLRVGRRGPASAVRGWAARAVRESGMVLMLATAVAGAHANDEIAIFADSRQVKVNVCEEPLGRLLEQVEAQSGIVLRAEAQVQSERVCVDIQGASWREVLEQLFQGYNKAIVYGDDGSMQRMILLNHATRAPEAAELRSRGAATTPLDVTQPKSDDAAAEDRLSDYRPLAPPQVALPDGPARGDVDELAPPTAFLRGLIAPPDPPELASPPDGAGARPDLVAESRPQSIILEMDDAIPPQVPLPVDSSDDTAHTPPGEP